MSVNQSELHRAFYIQQQQADKPQKKASPLKRLGINMALTGAGMVAGGAAGAAIPVSDMAVDKYMQKEEGKLNGYVVKRLLKDLKNGKPDAAIFLQELDINRESLKGVNARKVLAEKIKEKANIITKETGKKFLKLDRAFKGSIAGCIATTAAILAANTIKYNKNNQAK